ncbi:replication initiation and membrane attachment family protein [Oceanobacillus kapialis]|uniref:Uncharacterized protein n=1 Tax=Oceanobacillus kapialis TaxID=481353 RepID=A0ABW5PXL8_9BACI
MSKYMMLIKELDSLNVEFLLKDLAGGKDPSEYELKIINDIASRKNLDLGIMNAVIHYALLQDEMKLKRSSLEKAASILEKEGVRNVAEALLVFREYRNKKPTNLNREGAPSVSGIHNHGSALEDVESILRKLGELEKNVNDRFERLDNQLDRIENRIDGLQMNFNRLNSEFEKAFTIIDKRFTQLDAKFEKNKGRFTTE